ncbi:MAG: T9SS type A sorting domain-containing protein [Crocinitomicaceae bacterium]|nr:T9SS type A sorting domain-containing protein [Crocinitomicaceae bacterium]
MMKKIHIWISLLFISTMTPVVAQFGFEFNDQIVIKVGIDTLHNAWGGGLNYPQISDFDFDFDGDMDLFAFDVSYNNIRVFSQENNGSNYYRSVYDAKSMFPNDIAYKGIMVDYDMDGRNDLFTQGLSGLKVYRNVGDVSNGVQWELVSSLLQSQYPNNMSNLYVSASDVPAIIDVDGDGDIDILTFQQGGRHIEYHQNQSMELYGIPDSLVFELRNQCWGKFSEDVNTNAITLNDPNYPCTNGDIANPEVNTPETKSSLHAGSTLLAFDYNNSGVLDLVIGDVSFTNMNLLINGGAAVNTDSPMISSDPAFPSNTTPIDMHLFPAAYYVDVDFDGIKDLIVTPNARNVSENENSVLFYKNLGVDNNPTFFFSSNNYLQNQMIDHGTGTVPVFFDFDEDGLEDMIVANFFRYKPILDKGSTIAWYKNTGTAVDPEYTFIDNDFLGLASEAYGLRSIPAFGDLDNDGDDDLLLGVENGTLVYYENTSTGSGAVFSTASINYQDNTGTTISAGGFCHPQLFDLNNDGLLDLILGRRDGEIMYYENIGTLSIPSFQLANANVGGVDVSTVAPDGYAAPHFLRVNDTTHLFIGSVEGKLIYYSEIDGNLGVGDNFTFNSDNYLGIDVEHYSSFWVNDVDNDNNLDMFVGQDLGGLYHFEANPNSTASLNESSIERMIAVYPNPVETSITIAISSGEGKSYAIYDLSGQIMLEDEIMSTSTQVDIASFPQGFYVIHIELEDGRSIAKKVIKK